MDDFNPVGERFIEYAEGGFIHGVMDLIDDVNINYQNDYGETALMKASNNYGNLPLVKLLLDSGADPNLQDEDGNTALIFAASGGLDLYLPIIRLLLNKGANPLLKDNGGNTPYDFSLDYGNTDIIELLKYYTMMYKMQRKRRRNLTYRKKRTQLAHKNLALSKLIDTYDVDEPLTREMRRENIRSIFGGQMGGMLDKDKLPNDVLNQIIESMDCPSRLSYCQMNKSSRDYCNNPIVYDKYIKPCKLTSKLNVVNKKISERNKNRKKSISEPIDTNDTTEKFDWPV